MKKPSKLLTPRDVALFVRVSPTEREAYGATADACDLTISEWVRVVLGAASGNVELVAVLRRAEREAKRLATLIDPG